MKIKKQMLHHRTQLLQQPQIIPQLTTIPQLHPQPQPLHGQPVGWETVKPSRFTCNEPLQTTRKLNQGICKGKTKQREAIAKWGICDEHEILTKHHSDTNVIPYSDGECSTDRSKAWFAMPVAKTDLLQILKLKRAKKHSQQFREGIRAGSSYMHDHGWVHSDIKPDNILIHNDVPVLADFGLTTRQGTGPTLVGGKWVYPGVYPPYSTEALYKTDVHVNRCSVRDISRPRPTVPKLVGP